MMNAIASLAPALLQACMASAAVSLPVWMLLEWAVRRWPAIAASRAVWALAQLLILAAFLLVLLPQGAQLSVLAPIEVARAASVAAEAPLLVDAVLDAASDDVDAAAGGAWIALLAGAWLALYLAGALVAAARAALAQRLVRRLARSAQRLDAHALASHPAFASWPAPGLPVLETDAAVSPMLIGLVRPLLLVPRSLRSFSDQQQQLIVAHELAHWRRRDPLLLHASLVLQLLFWFNPALRAIGARLNWAQELGCDRAVLAGSGQARRRDYAAALVAQLKLQHGAAGPAALAFGGAASDGMQGRIGLIRDGAPAGRRARAMALALLTALLLCGAMLQPVFAWRADPAPVATVSAPPAWRAPFAQPRVTSFFGAPRTSGKEGHNGIDFGARIGTPVLAVADGYVTISTDRVDGMAQYGKVVAIEHANGLRSIYAHLDQRTLQSGAEVRAGQQIGLSGASGKVSGPHLHLEVSDGTRRIDPASLIPGLDQNATPSALQKRPPR